MIITTGDLRDKNYEILEVIFAYGSSDTGFIKSANPMEAYAKVRDLLKQNAEKMGANGVVFAHFDYRVAVKQGCGGGGQSFEVFGYGTAVKN